MHRIILVILAIIFLIALFFMASGVASTRPAYETYKKSIEEMIFDPVYIPRPLDHPDLKIPYVETYVPPTPPPTPKPKPPKPKPTAKPKPAPVVRVVKSVRFSWPVRGCFSQRFSKYHPAIDIACNAGAKVRASAAGKVIFAGWRSNGGGYQVWISHGKSFYTTYNHLSSILTRTGKWVGKGSIIGRVGSTGRSTGPHLHFEIWRGRIWSGGYRVNPLAYL